MLVKMWLEDGRGGAREEAAGSAVAQAGSRAAVGAGGGAHHAHSRSERRAPVSRAVLRERFRAYSRCGAACGAVLEYSSRCRACVRGPTVRVGTRGRGHAAGEEVSANRGINRLAVIALMTMLFASVSAVAALSTGNNVRTFSSLPACSQLRVPQPAMHMDGGHDGLDNWFDPTGQGERSAEYRAQQRALRMSSPQNKLPFDSDRLARGLARGLARRNAAAFDSGRLARGLARGLARRHAAAARAAADDGDGSWVVIFNAGLPNEGVFTTQNQGAAPTVLAFECMPDAERFGQLLLEQGFSDPSTPLFWSADRLTSFCRSSGFDVSMVARGMLPTPPSNTIERNDPAPHMPYPGGGAARSRDDYLSYRMWLEDLFHIPNDCDDDDCIIR